MDRVVRVKGAIAADSAAVTATAVRAGTAIAADSAAATVTAVRVATGEIAVRAAMIVPAARIAAPAKAVTKVAATTAAAKAAASRRADRQHHETQARRAARPAFFLRRSRIPRTFAETRRVPMRPGSRISGMLDIRLKPVESLLFHGDVVAVGRFRCPATHPLFRDSGPCSHHTFVFPRTRTAIRPANGSPFAGSPGGMVMYHEGQEYTRERIDPVDASDWYTIAGDVLLDIMRGLDVHATERRPFRFVEVPCDATSFLEQRRLFDALDAGEPLDPLQVEETVLRAVGRVLAQAYGMRRRSGSRDAVEQARTIIARDPAANGSLRLLAAAAGVSPFHLCREFRLRTGVSITQYRHSLRLRMALDRLRERDGDLTTIALDLGYSSHSHFTATFRRHFGITPAQYRDSARRSGSAMLPACASF